LVTIRCVRPDGAAAHMDDALVLSMQQASRGHQDIKRQRAGAHAKRDETEAS